MEERPIMDPENSSRSVPPGRGNDRRLLLIQALSLLAAIAILSIHLEFGAAIRTRLMQAMESRKAPKLAPVPQAAPANVASETSHEPSTIDSDPAPDEPTPVAPPSPPPLDRAAIAKAKAALDAASRDRARAEARADDAARLFAEATRHAALEASLSKTLAFRVRDPSAQISRTIARGGFLKAEREKLVKEVTALRRAPRAKATSIVSRTPVARVAADDEFHFELRHERVSFINLTQLLKMSKSDAQIRLRLSDRVGVISSKVGPVGEFSLLYVLSRAVSSPEDLLDRRSLSYELRGWELVPTHETRGETWETTRNPVSDFSRAIGRISPGTATITLWVYPDSFGLFRKLRDDLSSKGYAIAARPLPEGMSIRGSPMGSLSAAQ
jgi:hypothetical protein